MQKTNNFTEGKILLPLIKFAFPVLLALLLQAMYGAVDLLIVGKFAQTLDISAVSTGSMLMMTVTNLIAGLAMGLTVLLGQKIGEQKPDEASKTVGSGICLFAAVAAVLTVVMVVFAPQAAAVLHAPEDAFDATVDYIRICSAGMLFVVAFNVLGSVFRGLGDSKMPLITVAIACVVNIAGDLLLVAVFDMGTAGAALATVFAQGISVILSLIIIKKRSLPFSFQKKDIRFDKALTLTTLKIGSPMALQDVLVGISFLAITAIVNSLGLIESAGVGLAEKICAFIMLVPSAYMQSMSAFVAQNIGAKKPKRAISALLCGISTSFIAGLLTGYLSFFHGDILASLFADDTAVIAAAADYLRAYAIDCLLTAVLFCFIGYFSGRGKTVFVMLQGIIGAFCVRIPVSFFVSKMVGISLFHIGLATPASTVVQIILCLAYMAIIRNADKKSVLPE